MAESKIIRASDNNILKRFVKKHFGVKYLSEMTDKQLQQVRDKPTSVFQNFKNMGQVDIERSNRNFKLDKAYKDKVLRDHSKMLKDLNANKAMKKRYYDKKKKEAATVKKATGGRITKKKK